MLKLRFILFLLLLLVCSGSLFAQTADIYQKAADGYLPDKNYQAAYDNYTIAISKSDGDKEKLAILYYKRGASLNALERTDEAIKDYNSSLAINPQFAGAYWDRGVAYDGNRKPGLAIPDFRKAIELLNGKGQDSREAILYCNIAFDELQLGKIDEALKDDSIAIIINNQYSRGLRLMGNIHFALGRYDLAVEDITQAIFSYKGDNTAELSLLYVNRADAKQYLKKYKDAINDYTLAISADPNNRVAYWNRAATYHYNGDYSLAADDYTKSISFYTGDKINLSKLYQNRASNELGQSLITKAIRDDSLAVALDPTNIDAYYDQAVAYTQNGDYQLGIDVFKKILPSFKRQDKALALLYYQIANNEYFLNEFDKVVADCSKAIDLNPNFPSSYYYRAKVYLKKLDKKQSAIKDFNKVIALDTAKTVNYIFALFYTGKADEAVATLQNDLLKTNDNAQLLGDYYNLACLYSLMNKPDEANIYLKKAIDNGYAKKYAIADEDLDNIRNTDDYKSIMASTPGQ